MAASSSNTYRLDLKPQKRNIFVTQLQEGDYEDDPEPEYTAYPVVKETAGKLLENGLNTLQKTLLLKKEIEVDQVDDELSDKREEFRTRMGACTEKQVDVQKRQQKMKDRVLKFEKFIKENESKRRRAIHKYHTEVKLKQIKTDEYEMLLEQLETLRSRQISVTKQLTHHKKYHDFLMKVVDILPENYIEMNEDPVSGLMMRHQTLSDNNEVLVDNLEGMTDEIETLKSTLDEMKQNHDKTKLSINSRLSHMQKQQEDQEEINQHIEEKRVNKKAEYRDQLERLGTIFMSIDNISEKCLKEEKASVDEWSMDRKLMLIMEHLNDMEDVYRMSSTGTTASGLTESSPPTDRRKDQKNKTNPSQNHPPSSKQSSAQKRSSVEKR